MTNHEWAFTPNAIPKQDRPNISGPSSDKSVDGEPTTNPEVDTTTQLVRRAQQGDREAFGALYRQHHASIYRLARSYVGGGADDVVAETFLRAWKGLRKYRNTGAPFVSWLYGIARHVLQDEFRRQRRSEPRDVLPEGVDQPSIDDGLVLAENLARLPDEQRRVIEMKYLLGMKNPEVAQVLRKSTGAVNALQWRALKSLKELMDGTR